MGVEVNLCPNPALANNETGWVPTPLASYARSATVTTLPRTTGYAGTVLSDINGPRHQVTAGNQYVISVSIHAYVAQHFELIANWYNAASGGTFIANSGSVPVSLAAGATARFIIGPYTAPAGAVSGHLKFNDVLDGGAEITALRCAPYSGDLSADGVYFDGATPGAVWDGTAGNSTSSRLTFSDTVGMSSTWGNVSTTAPGYTPFVQSVGMSASFTVSASGPIVDTFYAIDGFLVASVSFDDKQGRVRVNAFTFAPSVTHARVRRRDASGGFNLIRGGEISVVGGQFSRIVDDYEYPAGVASSYSIEGLTDTEQVVQRAIVQRTGADDKVWLKFVANPRYNRRVNLVGWSKIRRRARAGHFDVKGRSAPVVTSDIHSSRTVTVSFLSRTKEETEALDSALGSGAPIYLQVPKAIQLPTLYASIGDYEYGEPSVLNSGHSLFTVPLIEISAPSAAILGSLNTYLMVSTSTRTYDELLAAYDSYERLAAS